MQQRQMIIISIGKYILQYVHECASYATLLPGIRLAQFIVLTTKTTKKPLQYHFLIDKVGKAQSSFDEPHSDIRSLCSFFRFSFSGKIFIVPSMNINDCSLQH